MSSERSSEDAPKINIQIEEIIEVLCPDCALKVKGIIYDKLPKKKPPRKA